MKKVKEFLITILWAISLVVMWPYGGIRYFFAKRKGKKYLKYKERYLPDERYATVYTISRLSKYLMRFKIHEFLGREKISAKPQMIICNHKSNIDALLLFNYLYKQVGHNFVFVAKKELKETSFGSILDLIDTIYFDRNNPREAIDLIKHEVEVIKSAKIIVVFPEGTRNPTDELLEFKSGAFEPAYKTMCSIQPMLLTSTNQYLEDKKNFKGSKKQPIKLEVLEEIKPQKFIPVDRNILARNIRKSMQESYDKLIEKNKKEN